MPDLTHPDSKQTITVAEDAVQMYRTQGWQPADEKKATAPKSGK